MDYHILCIDDDEEFLHCLKFDLSKKYHCSTTTNLRTGLDILQKETINLVLLDINLGEENGINGLDQIKKADPFVDVVMVTGIKDPKTIVRCVRAGASDYICKPFEMDELIAVIEKLEQIRMVKNRHDALICDIKKADLRSQFLGLSDKFCQLLDKADRLKGYNANILIEGESGTGKELLARYIHNLENDSQRPFIAVNCAAIPETLIESELFGYEKGAFTGAVCRKIGKFELADGGDIFLDEIGVLKPELQAKILRTLQEKEICRIGGSSPVKINFRVISATNQELNEMVEKGQFRMDIFHRLRVVHLEIPPLRERIEDIPILTRHFLDKYSKPGHYKDISSDTLDFFKQYRWPGNIRELENLVHNLIIMAPNGMIMPDDLPKWIKGQNSADEIKMDISSCIGALTLKDCVKNAEKIYIEQILKAVRGNKSKAANALKMSRTTLHSKLKELECADK